jgi:ribosome-associated toxin RatA of RatAB toxin-antitoxin module
MSKTFTMERHINFNSDLETVYRVLLDTENYPNYMEHIQSSNVINKTGDNSIVSYKAKISFFSFEYTIETIKKSHNHIVFKQQKGFFGLLSGEWKLKEHNDKVAADYIIHVKLPLVAVKKIVNKAMDLYFPSMLNDFKNEIENQFKKKNNLK